MVVWHHLGLNDVNCIQLCVFISFRISLSNKKVKITIRSKASHQKKWKLKINLTWKCLYVLICRKPRKKLQPSRYTLSQCPPQIIFFQHLLPLLPGNTYFILFLSMESYIGGNISVNREIPLLANWAWAIIDKIGFSEKNMTDPWRFVLPKHSLSFLFMAYGWHGILWEYFSTARTGGLTERAYLLLRRESLFLLWSKNRWVLTKSIEHGGPMCEESAVLTSELI